MSEPLWRSRPDAFSMLPATTVRQKRVADDVYLSEGYSNAFLVVTPAGRVVINTGLGFEAPVHKRYFDSVDAGPVKYIVLTQGHVDHVGGVDLFKEAGTLVVAQADNSEHQAYDARLAPFRQRRSSFAFAQAFRGMAGASGAPLPKQSQPKPDVLFRERFHFALGGVDFELVACNGAETRDSLVAWLPQRRVLFAGNVFGALFGHFPNLVTIRGDRYRDALEYVATLEMLLGFEAELLCVGHHDPVVGRDVIRSEIARMRDATLHVHDAIVAAMNAGKDVWTTLRELRLPPQLEVGEGYGKVSWSARAIWEQYQGWFHGRSTTELYGTPHWAVSPQLVALAGGPNAVAEAALKKAESAPLEALHLAEAALAADPKHAGALRASLAAHRTLLRGTANFWETRWLEHQIAQLEAALGDAA
ncbi:MAG TPA: MBL fold metallo-hydrolase [Myxococcota bacterium]|nr:MBL fold metallo-hydrolase [Myxococcota bacterium]